MVCGISLRGPCKPRDGLVNARSKTPMSPSWVPALLLCKGPRLSSSKNHTNPYGVALVGSKGEVWHQAFARERHFSGLLPASVPALACKGRAKFLCLTRLRGCHHCCAVRMFTVRPQASQRIANEARALKQEGNHDQTDRPDARRN